MQLLRCEHVDWGHFGLPQFPTCELGTVSPCTSMETAIPAGN